MSITYGFFNSVSGDRKYNADEMSEYFDGLVSNGVYESVGNGLQVVSSSGMTVQVKSGRALIDCKWFKNDAAESITISAAHATLNRYTGIMIQLNESNREIKLITRDGTAASSPSKPVPEDTSTITELCLAYVYVAAGATSISQSDITDMRGSDKCPWVTGLIKQVDTSELFLQYQTAYEEFQAEMEAWKTEQQTAFDEWFATLTGQLQVNTTIKEYRNVVTTSAEVTSVSIGISQYDSTKDILYANINGVMFVEGTDYTISGTGSSAKINLTNSVKADNTIEFRVLKSVIGQ